MSNLGYCSSLGYCIEHAHHVFEGQLCPVDYKRWHCRPDCSYWREHCEMAAMEAPAATPTPPEPAELSDLSETIKSVRLDNPGWEKGRRIGWQPNIPPLEDRETLMDAEPGYLDGCYLVRDTLPKDPPGLAAIKGAILLLHGNETAQRGLMDALVEWGLMDALVEWGRRG